MLFHETLRALRRRVGFRTQRQFAEAVGVHPVTVAKWETGTKTTRMLPAAANMRLVIAALTAGGGGVKGATPKDVAALVAAHNAAAWAGGAA